MVQPVVSLLPKGKEYGKHTNSIVHIISIEPLSAEAAAFVKFLYSFVQVFPIICHPSVHFVWDIREWKVGWQDESLFS